MGFFMGIIEEKPGAKISQITNLGKRLRPAKPVFLHQHAPPQQPFPCKAV
jgi:hypothetical protein